MKFDVEVGFISKLLQTKDIITVKDSHIKSDFFTGDNRSAFEYIYDSVLETGEVPSVRAFKQQFPRYNLEHTTDPNGKSCVGTEENLKFWCNELKKKVRHNYIADTVEKAITKLQDYESEDAYSLIKKSIAYIESEVTDTTDVDITKDTQSRKEAYLEKKKNKGMQGLPTGFSKLDYITKGLKDCTLTTVIANTGVGKTWLEIIMGSYLQLHNYRVLQCVTEMSEDIMRDRYEAMLFSMCYGEPFNYNAFKSGALDLKTEKLYFEFLENDLPNFEPLYITTATGVMGLSADIDKYNPDVIFIDSAYLMEDDQGAKDDWLRVAHITRDLKKLAKRCKKPILINTQADKNTSKKTGPELGSIMYTQAIGQDCLPENTMILTDCGYKAVQRLENEVFKVFDGENYKKARCTFAGEKEVTTITYRGNEFSCSPNHKLYVYDEEVSDFVWKKAKDIEPLNDFLLEQNFVTTEGCEHLLHLDINKGRKEMNIPIEADYELGMLIGIFIGDGSFKPLEKGQVTISCGQDKEYAEYCIELVHKYFDVKGEVRTIKSSTSGNDELVATWYCVKLAHWFAFFCADEAFEKTTRIGFCELNSNFRRGVLSGLIQSDGSCKSQVEIVSANFEVIRGANMLFKSLGICTHYDFQLNKNKGKHRLRIMSYDLPKLNSSLVGYKKAEFNKLASTKVCGRLLKPKSYIQRMCERSKHLIADKNSVLFKSVSLGSISGELSQKYLEEISAQPYKFMQVEDVVTTDTKAKMWDIQVFNSDKRIITNGIVTHNSDDVWALFRDEVMLNDKEMALKVLKQREGILGKLLLNWNFDVMDFSEIYADTNEDEDFATEEDEDNTHSSKDNTLNVMEE